MATRAETYRHDQERRGPDRPKRPRRRKVGQRATATLNRSKSAAKKAPYKLEDSRTRPSRKTTRGGANRMRQDAQLQKRQTVRTRSPSTRALRNTARKQGRVRSKVKHRRRR